MRGSVKNTKIVMLFLLILSVGISSLYVHSTTFSSGPKHKTEAKDKKEKEEKSGEEVVLSKGFVAVMPFFQLDLNNDLYLVRKFEFTEEGEETFESNFIPYTSRYFKTLFCFVISPNAP